MKIYLFRFDDGVDGELIEHLLAASIRNAEHFYGKPRVRLNASYLVSKHTAIIKVMDEAGEFILRLFTGNASDKIGDNRFTVEPKNELKGVS